MNIVNTFDPYIAEGRRISLLAPLRFGNLAVPTASPASTTGKLPFPRPPSRSHLPA